MHRIAQTQEYCQRIESVTDTLRAKDLPAARQRIAEAMMMDVDAPEPHNLLGILYELSGDYQAARKHYRAAYALDPTYKPSCRNLERITSFCFSTALTDIDFGRHE
jgi:Tfp pilus assembly protein PilF